MQTLKYKYDHQLPELFLKIIALENQYTTMILQILEQAVSSIILNAMEILDNKGVGNAKFHDLYKLDNDVLKHSTDINNEVDDLLAEAQKQLAETGEINIQEDEREKSRRLSLAGYQKHLEMLQSVQEGLQDEVNNFINDLQCHDLVRQMLENVNKQFNRLGQVIQANRSAFPDQGTFDFGGLIAEFSDMFTTESERDQFSEIFLSLTVIVKPQDITRITKDSSLELSVRLIDFMHHYLKFYQNIILEVDAALEKTVRYIGERLDFIIAKIIRLSTFSEDTKQSMNRARDTLLKTQQTGQLKSEIFSQMANDLKNVSQQHFEIADQLNPIITSLQFQDRTAQHFANWQNILHQFQQALSAQTDPEMGRIYDPDKNDFAPFGMLIKKESSMKVERDIICRVFGFPLGG